MTMSVSIWYEQKRSEYAVYSKNLHSTYGEYPSPSKHMAIRKNMVLRYPRKVLSPKYFRAFYEWQKIHPDDYCVVNGYVYATNDACMTAMVLVLGDISNG